MYKTFLDAGRDRTDIFITKLVSYSDIYRITTFRSDLLTRMWSNSLTVTFLAYFLLSSFHRCGSFGAEMDQCLTELLKCTTKSSALPQAPEISIPFV